MAQIEFVEQDSEVKALVRTLNHYSTQLLYSMLQYKCYVPYLILVLRAHLCFPYFASLLICTYRTALPLIPD
jgi:hypothetical protein